MDKLIKFSLDNDNAEASYELALWYENQGHTAPAHAYYLRAAELSENSLLSYSALIRASFCYNKQGSRDSTEKVLLENALITDPQRPEAYYFLSLLYSRSQNWQSSYIFSHLGLINSAPNQTNSYIPEYSGEHLLILQKATSAWWWGKGQECRDLLSNLVDSHWSLLDEGQRDYVQTSLSKLGITPLSQSQTLYTKDKFQLLRYKFPGSKEIKTNYSQVFQDLFVLSVLNGKREGTFLEIGGAKPFDRNNTALLELEFDWKGVAIEVSREFAEEYRKERPNVKVVNEDALRIDYNQLLSIYGSNTIDYLQLDIEPAKNTFDCLLKIPFDDYKFAVITYEHDYYIDVTRSYRERSRDFLKGKGYELVVGDISPEGKSSFEDWWVLPELVDPTIISIMRDNSEKIKKAEEYLLTPLSHHSKPVDNSYYAEFNTDKFIRENYFPDFSYKGVMVEVGAGPPTFISSSKHFRDNGWRTICVEPNPKFFDQHIKEGSEVYRFACFSEDGEGEFTINNNNDEWYSEDNDGVSFSSLEIRYKNLPSHNTQQKIKVKTIRLNTLLENIGVDKIDVLSIDVEGWELEVMQGFDCQKYDPKVIVLENFENDPKYDAYMGGIGYEKSAELGYNHIFTKVENKPEIIFQINSKIKSTSWIIDNFYENPDTVRKFALKQEYLEGGIGRGFIGRRTAQQFLFQGLKEKFETIMGRRIIKWEDYGMNGRFQVAWSGEPLVYHCDNQMWGGMLYLTPGAPFQCGTTLYAHRQTRARSYYDEGWDAAWVNVPGDCHLDGTPFEPVDVLGNVYNRLVIFDASCIHSASQYFGTVMENARLWQMFFFDTD